MIRDAMSCNLTIIDWLMPLTEIVVVCAFEFDLFAVLLLELAAFDVAEVVAFVLFPFTTQFDSLDVTESLRFNVVPFSLVLVIKSSLRIVIGNGRSTISAYLSLVHDNRNFNVGLFVKSSNGFSPLLNSSKQCSGITSHVGCFFGE